MENQPQIPQQPIVTQQSNSLAIASLILAIVGVFGFGPLTSIPAIICGHMGRSAFRKNPAIGGDGMAVAGLVIGYTVTMIVFLFFLVFIVVIALAGSAHSGSAPHF